MDSLISTAREFCTWCKSSPETKSAEGRKAHSLLTRLYAEALELDEPATYNADIESGRVNDEEWKEVYARAAALPFQYYSSQFDPSDVEPEGHEIGDLADDVADIYRDLSEGLALVDAGHIDEAQWAMRFSFLTHWGRHASGAIRALHCWYVDAYEF
jgi:hypothetical protein